MTTPDYYARLTDEELQREVAVSEINVAELRARRDRAQSYYDRLAISEEIAVLQLHAGPYRAEQRRRQYAREGLRS